MPVRSLPPASLPSSVYIRTPQPDPNEQSAVLLIPNQSAILSDTPAIPSAQEAHRARSPPSRAGLLVSLLVAFIAMLDKQWLNRYLRNSGGLMIECYGVRRRAETFRLSPLLSDYIPLPFNCYDINIRSTRSILSIGQLHLTPYRGH